MGKRQERGGEESRAAWERLREEARQRFGPEMVFGEGAVDATLAIVGEAPGEQEVAEGRPFVGRAGRLLDRLLREAGITTYVIYAWGDVLFSHMEVEDYDRMVERFNGDPVAQRWEDEVGELIEYPNADPETGWPEMLEEVWSL